MKLAFVLLSICVVLVSQNVLSQGTPLVPSLEVQQGETFTIKYDLHDSFGKPMLGANISATSDFFTMELYDDGLHDDAKANDGKYGNVIPADTKPGVYFVDIFYGNRSVGAVTVKIAKGPLLGSADFLRYSFLAAGLAIASYFMVYRGMLLPKVTVVRLEKRKKYLQDSVKKAEKQYFQRILDQNAFEKMMTSYKQEIITIDEELKSLKSEKS